MSQFALADASHAGDDMEMSSQQGGASDIEIDYEFETAEHDENMVDDPAEPGDEMMRDGDGNDEDREMEDEINWEEDEVLRDVSVDHTQDFEILEPAPEASHDVTHAALETVMAQDASKIADTTVDTTAVSSSENLTDVQPVSTENAAPAAHASPGLSSSAALDLTQSAEITTGAQAGLSKLAEDHPPENAVAKDNEQTSAPTEADKGSDDHPAQPGPVDNEPDQQEPSARVMTEHADDYDESVMSLELEHPIEIDFDGTKWWLFPSAENDGDAVCLLQEKGLLKAPLHEAITACKTALLGLGYTLRDSDELLLFFDALRLEIGEYSAHRCSSSLADIVQLYLNLSYNDDESDPPPLTLFLSQKEGFQARYESLSEHAAAGNGFSSLSSAEDEYDDDEDAAAEKPETTNDDEEQARGDVKSNDDIGHANNDDTVLSSTNEAAEEQVNEQVGGDVADASRRAEPNSGQDGSFDDENKTAEGGAFGNAIVEPEKTQDQPTTSQTQLEGTFSTVLAEDPHGQPSPTEEGRLSPRDTEAQGANASASHSATPAPAVVANDDDQPKSPNLSLSNTEHGHVEADNDLNDEYKTTLQTDDARSSEAAMENGALDVQSSLKVDTTNGSIVDEAANNQTNGNSSSHATPTETKSMEQVSKMSQSERQKYYAEVDLIDFSDGEDEDDLQTPTTPAIVSETHPVKVVADAQLSPGSRKRSLSDMNADEPSVDDDKKSNAIKKRKSESPPVKAVADAQLSPGSRKRSLSDMKAEEPPVDDDKKSNAVKKRKSA